MPSSPDHPADGPEALEALLRQDGELVLDRLEAWQTADGDGVFLHYGDEDRSLGFAEVVEATARLARGFRDLGVRSGDRVALYLTHPLSTILSMLALWRLDAVYCPLNYNLTGKLLAHPLRQLEPRLLVTEEGRVAALDAAASELAGLPPCVLRQPHRDERDHDAAIAGARPAGASSVVAFEELLASSPAERAPQEPSSIAAILQTSGTTGPSKGVVLSHRWINQYTFVPRRLVDRDDVIHNDLPLYHGAGAMTNVVRAAWVGCEVALWDRFSASEFWQRIAKRGATNAILIDVMIARLMGAEERPDDRENTLHTVNMVPLPAEHHRIASRFALDLVGTAYGQTETGHGAFGLIDEFPGGQGTPASLWRGKPKERVLEFARTQGYPVLAGDRPVRRGLMGKPTRFLEAAILGPDDQPLPAERYGELAFRARLPSLLLDGYFRRPEATAEAMRGGWLHTGDAAVQDAQGLLYYVDRMGGFIRSKGENISAFEVEEMVNAHPAVAMSAAVGVPALEGLEEDVAVFVVPRAGETLTSDQLAAFLVDTVPRYLRPRHVRLVDDLPRTATNKVEKYRLRDQLLNELRAAGEIGSLEDGSTSRGRT
jgi:crotonobetaine/carnitine-CoA ligase